jgi:HSP20 family protein
VREDGHLVVRADLPGIKPEEVKIEVEDDILTVSGEHEERTEKKHKHYVRRERRPRVLPPLDGAADGVDAKQITAETHDGVVEVTIPFPKEAEKETVTIKPTVA